MNQVIIPIHFGNPEGKHEISADSLIIFIQSYKEIALHFGYDIDIEIGVPEAGSWKTNLTVKAIRRIATILTTDLLVTLFTGMTLEDWAKKANVEFISPLINEFITTPSENTPENIPIKCLEQKNLIFKSFGNDNCIIDFQLANLARIPKINFPNYITEIPEKDSDITYFGEKQIEVSSIDWTGKNVWRGKTTSEHIDLSFKFDKKLTKSFWRAIENNELKSLHTFDVMRAQLLEIVSDGKPKYEVIRVLNYSIYEIDKALSIEEIEKVIKLKLKQIKSLPKQLTLEGF